MLLFSQITYYSKIRKLANFFHNKYILIFWKRELLILRSVLLNNVKLHSI